MISYNNLSKVSIGSMVTADDVTEFHAARLILLIRFCGKKQKDQGNYRLEGLTKLAKLDFFVRYPAFFYRIANSLGKNVEASPTRIESKMIRFHYGPWDKRYNHVLPYLKAKRLIEIVKNGNQYQFILTDSGAEIAKSINKKDQFQELIGLMKNVKKVLGKFSGSRLKSMVYSHFTDEVGEKALDELISYE